MRLYAVALMSLLAVASSAAAGDISFPYKAYVTSNEVYVRSGPGKNYYPTGKLTAGTEVEVYRHDPGGWYAIKPPEGSFAWVSGRFLEVGPDGLAKVTGEEVAARVGSEFSDIRDVIQVRLHKGEVVEVLDKKQFSAGSEAGTWYKISPPSGEFRWVFGKFIDPDFPRDGVRKSSIANNPLVYPGPAADRTADRAERQSAASQTERAPIGPSAARINESAVATSYGEREFRNRADSDADPRPTRQISPEEFQEQLDKLDVDLSVMLVEEPTVWNFDELNLRAKSLLLQAETAVERGKARTLLNKIAQSEDIKHRYDTVAKLRTETERDNRQLAELNQSRSPTDREADDATGRYDGVGRLARVVSPKVGAPQYALVDDKGAVQCYVTPAPGVNMQYYLGKRVGVVGVRGFITEQRAQHVMAKHVTSLDAGGTTVR